MRFVLFVFGIALGIAGTLAYAAFSHPSQVPAATPPDRDPQLAVTVGPSLVQALVEHAIAEIPGAGSPTLQVALRDDAIAVDASIEVLGKRATGTVLLRPRIERGTLRVALERTSLGDLTVPGLDAMLERQINDRLGAIERTLAAIPVSLTGVRVDRDGMTVSCRVSLVPTR